MAGKRGRRAAARRVEEFCDKCGLPRRRFKSKRSFAQHRRFCKKKEPAIVPPIPPGPLPFSGPSAVEMMRKQALENGGTVERLKAEAATLRKKSDEILEYVKSFEAGASKFLSK